MMEDEVRLPLRILMAVLLIVPACNRNEPRIVQAAPEEPTNAVEGMKTERNDYVEAIDNRLVEFEQQLDELDQRANAMTGTTKASFNKAIDCLRDKRKSVASKLDDLKKVKIESWTTLRGKVDSALDNLERCYTKVSGMMYEQESYQAR
jgi:hypothetical protein